MSIKPIPFNNHGGVMSIGDRDEGRMELTSYTRVALYCVLLVVLNPITYVLLFRVTLNGYFPDSPLYLVLAERITNGWLWIDGWGHVDQGVILSPFYSIVIVVFDYIGFGRLASPIAVSLVFSFLSPFLFFYLVSRFFKPSISFFSALCFCLSYEYIYYASAVLSEGVFVFLQLLFLCFLYVYCRLDFLGGFKSYIVGIGWGLVSALLVLCRPPGIVATLLAVAFQLWFVKRDASSAAKYINVLGCYLIGLLILVGPYLILLYQQTGNFPSTQYFRESRYVVTSELGGNSPNGNLSEITNSGYADILKQRRRNYQLNAEGSEMKGYLVTAGDHREWSPYLRKVVGNLIANLSCSWAVYSPIFLLFVFWCCGILKPINRERVRFVGFLALYMVAYLLFVSIFSGGVARYFDVLGCVSLIYVLAALTFVTRRYTMGYCVMVLWVAVSVDRYWGAEGIKIGRWPEIGSGSVLTCKNLITDGDPVFSFAPLDAFIVGGRYRIIPNSGDAAIFNYAKRTGVKWLALSGSQGTLVEIGRYEPYEWIRSLLEGRPKVGPFVKRCDDRENLIRIYSIE